MFHVDIPWLFCDGLFGLCCGQSLRNFGSLAFVSFPTLRSLCLGFYWDTVTHSRVCRLQASAWDLN